MTGKAAGEVVYTHSSPARAAHWPQSTRRAASIAERKAGDSGDRFIVDLRSVGRLGVAGCRSRTGRTAARLGSK